MAASTLGVIIGNRDFFPDHLVTEARNELLELFKSLQVEAVLLGEQDTPRGAVETWDHAKKCANLFKSEAERIEGILVVLPNFGDEKGVLDSIELSGLDVPILIQAYPDDLDAFDAANRRDAFCGKISVCNNLKQYGHPFSLTRQHTVRINAESFTADLKQFLAVCRVVRGLRGARLGAIGARPNAFNTVRYSEKLLQASGISVCTIDLSEIHGEMTRLGDGEKSVVKALGEIKNYVDTSAIPEEALIKMAKFRVVVARWMAELDLDATAIQCWTSVQQNIGINVCGVMSLMSDRLLPSACEVDVTGVASMYALQLASGRPSALVDWNNNYGGDPDKCVLFHCGNWAKSFFREAKMANAEILASTLSPENTYGTIAGRVPAGPMSYARLTTDDRAGCIRSYVGDGQFVDDELETFGSRAVIRVQGLQALLSYICRHGFEHHTAMSPVHSAAVLEEAFGNYMGWDVYRHTGAA